MDVKKTISVSTLAAGLALSPMTSANTEKNTEKTDSVDAEKVVEALQDLEEEGLIKVDEKTGKIQLKQPLMKKLIDAGVVEVHNTASGEGGVCERCYQ